MNWFRSGINRRILFLGTSILFIVVIFKVLIQYRLVSRGLVTNMLYKNYSNDDIFTKSLGLVTAAEILNLLHTKYETDAFLSKKEVSKLSLADQYSGRSEFLQYYEYHKRLRNNLSLPCSIGSSEVLFTNDFNASVINSTLGRIRINLKEYHRGVLSRGGSSFRVIITTANVLDRCWYMDYFNGSYAIDCPVYPGCSNIELRLSFILFGAFRPRSSGCYRSNIRENFVVCLGTPSTICSFDNNAPVTSPEIGSIEETSMHWIRPTKHTPFQFGINGCPIILGKFNRSLGECRIKSMTALGASHLRNVMDWIMVKFGLISPNLEQRYIDHISGLAAFHWAPSVQSVISRLKNITNQMKTSELTSTDVLLLQCGHHDTRDSGHDGFLKQWIKFIDVIRNLRQHLVWKQATIIVLNVMAFPDIKIASGAASRNNVYFHAINYILRQELKDIDVYVVDDFSLHYIRSEENVCNAHYICKVKGKLSFIGDVGITFVEYFLSKICDLLAEK